MMKRLFLFIVALLPLATLAVPNITFSDINLSNQSIIAIYVTDKDKLTGAAAKVNTLTNGRLSQAIEDSEFSAKFGSSKTFYGLSPFKQVVVIGAGSDELDKTQLQELGGYATAKLPTKTEVTSAIIVDAINTKVSSPLAYIALGSSLRDYHFDKYKQEDDQTSPRNIVIQGSNSKNAADLFNNDLQYVAKGVYLARDMSWEPGKSIYPQAFVERVKPMFDGIKNVTVKVLEVSDMEKYNMGALMGVGKGSVHDPRLLIVEYMGDKRDDAPIVLAGKGITFDTGGISLKPNSGMWAMKSDLSGAAAVAGTMYAISKRQAAVNVVGLMPLAENMPAEDAIRPGDVLTSMQGTTIEILSTDAEGRLILADAVRYGQDTYKPKMLLNIATLTGSAGRALSDEYAALFTREWALSEEMMEIGKASGVQVWPLPLHPNHFKQIKSDIADIKNSGAGRPGASIGAAFIGTFIDEDLPWVHLDIAGVDWLNADEAVVPKGAQGWGVRFMDELIRQHSK